MLPARDADLEAMVAVQAALSAELRAANAALRARLGKLEAANARLAEANASLAARVAELERRLGQDSSNSSKPPSQDGLGKAARPARRAGGGRRPGKQPGAPGAHLAQVAEPAEVVVHVPDRCGGCGGALAGALLAGVEVRQVFDLPELRMAVTEHRVERRRCTCGVETAGRFPERVRAPAQYGPGLRALGCYLLVHQHLPIDRAAQLLADLGEFAATVRDLLVAAPVAHFDETGARWQAGCTGSTPPRRPP